METKKEIKVLILIVLFFVVAFFLPVESNKFFTVLKATLSLIKWYAREHVILCLLPAFFIAGVISVFVSQESVLRYFGANAKKWLAYSVAAVSGTILTVCSCTILPLFSSIYKRGAGLGPAITFLYSGPAINILAIILTARILGFELGIARTIGAVFFSIAIGLMMSFYFRKEEKIKKEEQIKIQLAPEKRPMWQTLFHFFTLVFILVFANWGNPAPDDTSSIWYLLWAYKWYITGFFSLLLCFSLIFILKIKWQWILIGAFATIASILLSSNLIENEKNAPLIPMIVGVASLSVITLLDKHNNENREWTIATWGFVKQILPSLAIGIIIAGILFGFTNNNQTIPGIIPHDWIKLIVGGNSVFSNFFASIIGAFMYFSTLTEIPILQGLITSGMGKGPALALLLAGPSLSLPNMLVINSVLGLKKTIVYVCLVVVMATISGLLYGSFF